MMQLYRCKYSGGYYTLKGNTLTRVTYGFSQKSYTNPKVNHTACLAIGLVLIGNNFKELTNDSE